MPNPPAPETGRIPTATATFGVSRSWLYRTAPLHPGLLKKNGRTTLVDFAVLRSILAALPAARIGVDGGKPADAAQAA